jgi:hypothetical protein
VLSETPTQSTGQVTGVPTSQRSGGVMGVVARQYADARAGTASAVSSSSARPRVLTGR